MAELRVRVEQIEALQATAAALLAQCHAILPPQPDPDLEVPATGPLAASGCLHENKEKAPRMGAPNAWYCPDCHEQGE